MSPAPFWVGDVRVPFPNHGGTLDPIVLVVAHTLECEAIDGLGEDLARGYFQHEAVSVHAVSDPGKTVGGLPSNVRGYHAGPKGNAAGWADEVTGRAAWTRNDWLGNPKRNAALMQQAKSMGLACKQAGFRPEEVRWLSVAEVRDGNVRGCCYHYDISRAWGQSTHWDPGPGYPPDVQMDRIRWYAGVADYWGSSDKNRPDDVTPLPNTPSTGGAQEDANDMADITPAQMDEIAKRTVALLLSDQPEAVIPVDGGNITVRRAISDLLKARFSARAVWREPVGIGYAAGDLLNAAAGNPKAQPEPKPKPDVPQV